MSIPNSSNAAFVAELRYIQTIRERRELRNPDILVKHLLSIRDRWRMRLMRRDRLNAIREDPFYYYLLARTRHYDAVYREALAAGVSLVANVGCGADTRPYRFGDIVKASGIKVLECDQAEAIERKRALAARWRHLVEVTHLPIDLNDGAWPVLTRWLQEGGPALVVMEGVSPYIDEANFIAFLRMIATCVVPGTRVAYDYKVQGVKVDFGRQGRTRIPFRLSPTRSEVEAFHKRLGFAVLAHETSSDLCQRLVPNRLTSNAFEEDALVQLEVQTSHSP